MAYNDSRFLPTSKKEMDALGWEQADVILFTGDAYIDHPSFGTAVIGRYLEKAGYKVAIVPQPNWRDDLRDFKKLGKPKLFFGVSAGAMDSMVNHYTAGKRLRSNDAYTADGKSGQRPDYAVTIYSTILKKLFPEIPVVIGGIEASLRRFTHYDYWQDKLLPSVLVSSEADILVYGMGERPMLMISDMLSAGESLDSVKHVPQVAYLSKNKPVENDVDTIYLNSHELQCEAKIKFVENFNIIENQSNILKPLKLVEKIGNLYNIVNPPFPLPTTEETDSFFDLPFTRQPHPRYKGKHIPAFEMIKNSVNIHRGCFGACSFCTISAHQGKFVYSRSEKSVLQEIEQISSQDDFNGVLTDVGGPTANMYKMRGKDLSICEKCKRESCIYPNLCKNLDNSHAPMLNLYDKILKVKGIKRFFIGSGIRYDLFLNENGYTDSDGNKYLKEVIEKHTSGWFKVAPEHTEERVLKAMGKPSFKLFEKLKFEFDKITTSNSLNHVIVPYFISSHPGCNSEDMKRLALNPVLKNIRTEQVQDFTPTPMTRSSVAFYSGIDPKTLKSIFVEKDLKKKQQQKGFFYKKN